MSLDKLRLALELAERLHDLVDELDESPKRLWAHRTEHLLICLKLELGVKEARRINALRRCTTSA